MAKAMPHTIHVAGMELVKQMEGFYSEAYRCPAGVWTIGYGHTKGVHSGQHVSHEEAEELLAEDLAEAAKVVEAAVKVSLNENQFSALVSFVFNVGSGNFRASTLLSRLNAREYDAVPSELCRWVKATNPKTGEKRALPGLVKRRAKEGELWLSPIISDDFISSKQMPQQVEAF